MRAVDQGIHSSLPAQSAQSEKVQANDRWCGLCHVAQNLANRLKESAEALDKKLCQFVYDCTDWSLVNNSTERSTQPTANKVAVEPPPETAAAVQTAPTDEAPRQLPRLEMPSEHEHLVTQNELPHNPAASKPVSAPSTPPAATPKTSPPKLNWQRRDIARQNDAYGCEAIVPSLNQSLEVTKKLTGIFEASLRTNEPKMHRIMTRILKVAEYRGVGKQIPENMRPILADLEIDKLLTILASPRLTVELKKAICHFDRYTPMRLNPGGGFCTGRFQSTLRELVHSDNLHYLLHMSAPKLANSRESAKVFASIESNLRAILNTEFVNVLMTEHGAANMNYCIKTALGMMASPATPFPTE
jgi:hypothetical protein